MIRRRNITERAVSISLARVKREMQDTLSDNTTNLTRILNMQLRMLITQRDKADLLARALVISDELKERVKHK